MRERRTERWILRAGVPGLPRGWELWARTQGFLRGLKTGSWELGAGVLSLRVSQRAGGSPGRG